MFTIIADSMSEGIPFCFGFREYSAGERWLLTVWAGDGAADRRVLGHPHRATSSSDQVLNS